MSLDDWIVPAAVIAAIAVSVALVRIGAWIGRVDSDRESFKEFMDAVRGDFKEVRADIKNILVKVSGPQTVERGIPLRLTELGKKNSEEINAYTIAHQLSGRVKRQIEGMTAYDIQEFCMTYVSDEWEMEPHHEHLIKNAAFNHGIIKKQVLEVVAIELRDILLAPSTTKTVE